VSRETAGAAIRALRESRDWSLAELAAATGVSTMGLSYLERGTRKPQKRTVQRVENGLGLPPGTYARLVVANDPDIELAQLLERAGSRIPELPGSAPVTANAADMLEMASAAYLEMLNSLIEHLPPVTSNEYETYIRSALAQSAKAEMLAANSWRVTAGAGTASPGLMAHITAAERIRSDLIARLSGSTAARLERACAGRELPDPVVAALIGVTVGEMWEIRTGGPIPPAALPRINAFLEGLS
jgi:transcriptional regulator with XRE-family HTH domain